MPSNGSTNARGYGWQHRHKRAALLAALQDGTPCPRCGQPMAKGQRLDLDHTDDRTGYLGLTHEHCNRSAPRRDGTPSIPPRRNSREW